MQEFVTADKGQLRKICGYNNYGLSLDFDFENTVDDEYTEATTEYQRSVEIFLLFALYILQF